MVAVSDFLLLADRRLFVVSVLGKKIINADSEHIGNLFQHDDIGKRLAPFPFGHRLVRIIQALGKLRLRQM